MGWRSRCARRRSDRRARTSERHQKTAVAVVGIRPDVNGLHAVDQLGGDPHPLAGFADVAVEHVARAELRSQRIRGSARAGAGASVEMRITEHLYNGFRFAEGLEMFKPRMRVLPEAAQGMKATVQDNLAWLDALMKNRAFIVGDRFTVPDIILYCATDFGRAVGQTIDPKNKNLTAWFARVGERPSARGSLHPRSAELGFAG